MLQACLGDILAINHACDPLMEPLFEICPLYCCHKFRGVAGGDEGDGSGSTAASGLSFL